LRIVRGKLKSRRIQVPKGFASRPTTDYAKEGLFNVLDNLIDFEGLHVLDLCSGTGNISLEFASGEAEKIVSVDNNFSCVNYLNKIAKELKVDHQITVFRFDIFSFIEKSIDKFDLIFCDPPYDFQLHTDVINKVYERNMVLEDGHVIIEHGKQTNLQFVEGYLYTKNYGGVQFSFFQR
jgi:16S rRNA (guanine(966)-N(2))-methyltransferase RsmD